MKRYGYTITGTISRSHFRVSSVRGEEGPGHDRVHVWNRGGKSGELVVNHGDGQSLAVRLLGSDRENFMYWEECPECQDSGFISQEANVKSKCETFREDVMFLVPCPRCEDEENP
jgi:hypothetical protein